MPLNPIIEKRIAEECERDATALAEALVETDRMMGIWTPPPEHTRPRLLAALRRMRGIEEEG
jgi:hypothetical protein